MRRRNANSTYIPCRLADGAAYLPKGLQNDTRTMAPSITRFQKKRACRKRVTKYLLREQMGGREGRAFARRDDV